MTTTNNIDDKVLDIKEPSINTKETNTKSVSRTLSILFTFTEECHQQKTSSIAKKLGMNISTVSRHLTTLLDQGFVVRDDETGYYRLGLNIVTMAGIALYDNDLYRYGQDELQKLSNEKPHFYHLGIPHGTDIVHIGSSCGNDSSGSPLPIGHRHPLCSCAMGRAYLSTQTDEVITAIIKNTKFIQFTSKTKLDPEEILKSIHHARDKGYSYIDEELALYKKSLSVPVFGRNRTAVGAIGVTLDNHDIESSNKEKRLELLNSLRIASNRVSSKLGFRLR